MMTVRIFTAFTIALIGFLYVETEVTARFKSVKCSSSNQTLAADYKCFVKAYSRKIAKLSVLVTFEKPCYEALFDFDLSYRMATGRQYRTLINNTVDLCLYFKGAKNIVVEWLIDLIWKEIPRSFIHPCPYIGPFPLHNITIDLNHFSKFPNGIYKVHLKFFNAKDSNMLTVDTFFEIAGSHLIDF